MRGRMALLAQQGCTHLEHGRRAAAMGKVAVAAVFSHRIMLVHKGATLFGMTGVAGIVQGIAFEQLGTR